VLRVTAEQYNALVEAGVVSSNGKELKARGKTAPAKKKKSCGGRCFAPVVPDVSHDPESPMTPSSFDNSPAPPTEKHKGLIGVLESKEQDKRSFLDYRRFIQQHYD